MKEVQYAGEFKLENCEIIASSGVVAEISSNIVEINLFESIFSSSLTGSIIIADTNNLTDNLPIIGQEYISIKIVTPGLDKKEEVIEPVTSVRIIVPSLVSVTFIIGCPKNLIGWVFTAVGFMTICFVNLTL